MLKITRPLVSTIEELLRKDETDPDCVSAAMQQALLFLGNASVHFSQVRSAKVLKWLNPAVQNLAKDKIFSQSAPYLFGKGIEQKIK